MRLETRKFAHLRNGETFLPQMKLCPFDSLLENELVRAQTHCLREDRNKVMRCRPGNRGHVRQADVPGLVCGDVLENPGQTILFDLTAFAGSSAQ